MKTKDAVRLPLGGLGTIGSLLGYIGIKDFTARGSVTLLIATAILFDHVRLALDGLGMDGSLPE